MPIPPTPMTITVSPTLTCAEFTAEPQPVPTPHPSRHNVSNGISFGTFTALLTSTVVYSENVDNPAIWPTGRPARCNRKLVGSSNREPTNKLAPRSQRFCIPDAHQRQWPHAGRNEK